MSTRFVAAITYMTTLNAAKQLCLHIFLYWGKDLLEGGGGRGEGCVPFFMIKQKSIKLQVQL